MVFFPSLDANGVYNVSVTVRDDDGDTSRASFKINVAAFGANKFFLVDGADKGTFRYDTVGNSIDRRGLTPLNSAPRGIASTVAGDTVWVIDAARKVYVYSADGAPLGNWTAGNLYQPTDITTDGTDIWIVDDGRNMVFRYANAASRRSSHQGPVSSFTLPSDNLNPSGIVTDGNFLWITEDGPSLNRVFVYSLAGQKLGSWDLDPANGAPSGITLDPSGGDPDKNLWVVDRDDAVVYRYANATPLRGGSIPRADSYALVAANRQPEGIADPPIEFNAVDSRADLLQSNVLTPLHFEANQGQADEQVQFLSRGPGYSLFLMPTEAVLSLPQPVTEEEAGVADSLSPSVVRMQLVGADSAAAIVGQDELPGRVNYLIGNDPTQWQTDVPTYARVHYDDVYPGVDLIYYGNQQQLEYDFVVAPYADPSLITLRFSEVQGFEIADNGDLILHATTGDVVQRAPILYQDVNGIRESIEGAYVLLGDDQVGFEIGDYDTSLELVIDPILAVSSYFGGSNHEAAGIVADKFGNMFVVGGTASTDLPTKNALQPMNAGGNVANIGSDIFLAKFAPDGSLLFSTYFGGTGGEGAPGLVLDRSGDPIIVANTTSTDFPLRNPLQSNLAGSADTAVVKFLADGSDFVFSTYIGGPGSELAIDMAIDADGNLYVTGQADPGFPTKNAFQPTAAGGGIDAFVYELNAEGTAIVYSTYLGGSGGHDAGYGIAVDDSGAAYVAGLTRSSDFPTRNAFQNMNRGGGQFGDDAFVAKIAPNGADLVYSSFLGGSGEDRALEIAIDQQGSAYVTGYTLSTNFPTKNAFQSTFGGGGFFGDAFITKVGTAGDSLEYSTYVGDAGENFSYSIEVDDSESVFLGTQGDMRNRPTVGSLYFDYGSVIDPFIGQFDPTGQKLVRAVYLGGTTADPLHSELMLDLGPPGVVYFAGRTTSTDFPTVNAFQTHLAGNYDAVFGKLILETPSIAIATPADGDKIAAGMTVLVTGTASGPVLANGTPVDAFDAAGNFYEQVVIAPGQNIFSFSTTDRFSQTATATLMLTGTEPTAGLVDFSLFSDVSASFTPDYARTSFDQKGKILYADWAIRNSGQYPTDVPLYVGVKNISDPRVRVHEPVGLTPDGIPYFDFTSLVPGGRLSPNETTGTASLSFFNPERIQFNYDLVFFGMLNRAPVITSVPDIEALVDRPYSYDVEATDPDGDDVSYSLISGPSGSVIDRDTGLITWHPVAADIETYGVSVSVEDGRGGNSEQRYVLSVIAAPPNRPPVFTSVPVVSANVNTSYTYDADAIDPDGDTLSFSLAVNPFGMSIDGATGRVAWIPNANQVGLHTVTVVVGDGHGGQSLQQYVASVEQEPGNHPPIIVTDPVTSAVAGVPYTYDVDAIDPDNDLLTYSLTQRFPGMAIDAGTGVISWTAEDPLGSPGVSFSLASTTFNSGAGTGITVDAAGNFYISGHFTDTVDFDPGPGVSTRTSQGGLDVYVAKYNRAGGLLWARSAGSVGQESSYNVAVDESGNVYTIGHFSETADFDPGLGVQNFTSAGSTDAFVWKLDGAGNYLWTRRLGGPGKDSAVGDVSVDGSGNLVVSGSFSETVDFDPGPGTSTLTSDGGDEAFVWKLDSGGNHIWARRTGGSSNDVAFGSALDEIGNVYASGYFNDNASQPVDFDPGPAVFNLSGFSQAFIWKLDANGNFVWARELGGGGADISNGISVNASSDVYISGVFQGTVDFDHGVGIYNLTSAGGVDSFLLKLNSSGDFSWAKRFGGSGHDGVRTTPRFDTAGNIYTSFGFEQTASFGPGPGSFTLSSRGLRDFALVKLTSAGEVIWKNHIGGLFDDVHLNLAVDDCGNVHSTGWFAQTVDFDAGIGVYNFTSIGAHDIFVSTYSANGEFVVGTPHCDTITVRVDDGRGGFDTQSFTIDVNNAAPGEIRGTKFNDLDGDQTQDFGHLLVSSLFSSTVLRYDGATGNFVDPFVPQFSGGLSSPTGVIFGPDGNLYVGSQSTASVLRYNGTTGAFIDAFVASGSGGLSNGLTYFEFGPDGNLYVEDAHSRSILRYHGTTGAFIDVFASGAGPNLQGLAFGSDGNLYVSDARDVMRFNGTTGAFMDVFVPAGRGGLNGPNFVSFGPDGNLYVSSYNTQSVLRFDGHTGGFIDAFVPTQSGGFEGTSGFVFGPDGNFYVADLGLRSGGFHGKKVLRYNGKTGQFIDQFVVPGSDGLDGPNGITFTPTAESVLAGWTIYLDNNKNGRLDVSERSTVTDQFGHYTFLNLAPGTYLVAEENRPGWVQTAPASGAHQITVTSGQVVTGVDFGNSESNEPPIQQPNRDPQFTAIPSSIATIGQLFRYNATATDPDRDPLSFDLVVKPIGMAVDPSTGIVVWVPTADQLGEHDVTLRVQDGRGGVDLQSFRITVSRPNSTPVITSQPKGPAVVAVQYHYQVTAQDADGDPVTFRLDAKPEGMTIDATTGLVRWTPAANQVGEQFVSVTASDNRGASTTQSFDLPVVATAPNNAPAITSSPRGTVRIGDQYLYQIIASDANGDPLTYSVPIAPTGMTVDANGLVTWRPSNNQLGPHQVQVRVADGRSGFATQTYTVNVVTQASNQPPSIVSTPPQSATVARQYAYDVRATDPDGDPLSFGLDTSPAGMSIDASLGTIRWTPAADQLGAQSVVVRVFDTQGGSATQSFSIQVRAVNLPPGITSAPPTEAVASSPYSYAVRAADPDGDPLTFALTQSPTGMTIGATGLIQWTPTAGQTGNQSVALRVTDGQGGEATQTYTVVVSATATNRPPVITSSPSLVATVGAAYSYSVTAVDPESPSVLWSLLTAPTGMTIHPTGGLIQWTPTATQIGLQNVTVAAIDPGGAGGTQTFSIAVADSNQPPAITSSPVQVVSAGLPYRYDVRATDPDGDRITFQLDTAPAGMTIDALGRITWAPAIANIGTHRIAVTVEDTRGAFQTQTYDMVVRADQQTPRVNLLVSDNPAEVGSFVTFVVTATDNVGVASLGLTINGNSVPLDSSGRVTLEARPVGTYQIVASASDAAGNTGLASTSLLVRDTSDIEAPDVAMTSPLDNAVITAPINVVGTASDTNLLFYTLSAAPMGSATFREMFRGTTSVTDGVLGKFDPSGLANDTYTLRLSATDAGGNEAYVDTVVEVAGDLKIGNFTLSFTDLTVPVSGIPITVSRTYDTLQSGRQDDMGYGWRLEFRDTDLRTSVPSSGAEEYGSFTPYNAGARVYVTAPGGRREGFTFQPRRMSGFGGLLFSEPHFEPDASVTSRLSVPSATLVVGSDGLYYGANGLAYNPTDELNWGGVFFLTTKDGIAYEIDANTGDLLTLSDANANTLTFSDTAIASNRGPRVTFERDPQGRITASVDPSGQKVRYKYDGRGDLVEVTDREGNVTTFVYASPSQPHYLTEIIDPLGRTGVRTEYDSQGRLIKLIDAADNPVQLIHDPDNFVETIRDAAGHTTTFEYDVRGNVVTEVDDLGNITRRTYDGAANMLTESDPLGNVTSFSYDGDGNVLTETDPLGNVTRFTYTTVTPGFFDRVKGARSVSLLATKTDPLGNTTTNTYSGTNLVSSRDSAGNVTTYAYDGAGNQTSITDAEGNVTQFAYDGAGNLLRQVDALGNATTFTYDASGNQLTQTTTLTTLSGATGVPPVPVVRTLVTSTQYDASGHPIRVTDAEGNETSTEYDKLGNQVATVDALGRRTEFTYDERGQLVGLKYPDGSTTATVYDELGRRISSTDRAGRVTWFVYDALGRLTTTISPDGTPADNTDNPRTRSEYDQAGRVTAQIDELGHRTEFVYDAAGRQTVVRNALGQETITTYDDAGRTLSTVDALAHTTQFVYDTLGRQVQTKLADGTATSTTYDALGRSIAQTDQAGRVTMFEYDRLGRLTAVVDALSQRTEYTYDEAGNLITQQDANSHVTRYEYDGLGRRTAHVLPMGQRSTTVYDAVGNVASTKDFNGDTIQFSYDVSNRLLKKTFPDDTSVAFTYTVNGQRSTSTALGAGLPTPPAAVTRYEYDERDRLISRTDPDGAKIAYGYDAVGNRISTTTTVPTNPPRTTAYTFDELNRSKTVTDPEGGQTRYFYDAVSRLIRTELPNNTAEKREYDAVSRLLFLENRNVATDTVISSYRYTLDPTGNRTGVVEHDGRRVAYDYDALYRLISEDIFNAGSATLSRSIDYSYDDVGNRLTRTDSGEGTTTYDYDDNDRLLTESLAALGAGLPTPPPSVTQYTYDNNGNTLSKISATDRVFYDWDFENRLVSADTNGDGTADVQYQYDAEGIRVSSTSDGQETRYLIDPSHPFQQVVEEYTPGGVIKVSYVHGLDLISQNRPADSGKSFYHVDGLGSTRALTNASGLDTDRYIYDAFGRTIGQVGSTGNVYLFAGEQRDLATGLDYLRARYLSPSIGRFFGSDPFRGVQSSPITLHRFLYASGNPVNFTDPSGYFTLIELTITVSILGVINKYYFSALGKALRDAVIVTRFKLKPGADLQDKGLRMLASDQELGYDIYVRGRQLSASGFSDLAAGLNTTIITIGKDLIELAKAFESAEKEERSLSNAIQEKADFFHETSLWLTAFAFLADSTGSLELRGHLDKLAAKAKTFSLVFNEVANSDLLEWIDDVDWP